MLSPDAYDADLEPVLTPKSYDELRSELVRLGQEGHHVVIEAALAARLLGEEEERKRRELAACHELLHIAQGDIETLLRHLTEQELAGQPGLGGQDVLTDMGFEIYFLSRGRWSELSGRKTTLEEAKASIRPLQVFHNPEITAFRVYKIYGVQAHEEAKRQQVLS